MSQHDNSAADPKEVKKAQDMWRVFTEMSKLGVVTVIGVLIFMALFLL
jgi:hypothetical protein